MMGLYLVLTGLMSKKNKNLINHAAIPHKDSDMKKITLYATTVITVGLLCYLGLSGYVWYYDKQRSKKKAMCRLGCG